VPTVPASGCEYEKLLYFPDSDIVCFLTGLLLGPDPASRAWLSQWVRAGQKRRACAALAQLRQEQCWANAPKFRPLLKKKIGGLKL
jgi:hypothetical protein